MRVLRILLLSLFPAAALAADSSRDLVAIPQSAQQLLQAQGVPVTFKGSAFFLAEWSAADQVRMASLGVPFEVILRDVRDDTSLFLFELHEGEEPPSSWLDRILYRQRLNVIVTMEDAEAQEWAVRGSHPVRLWHKAHGWGEARPEFVTYDCTYRPLVADLLSKTTQSQWLDWIEKLSGVEPVAIGGTNYTIATRFTARMFSGATNAKGFDFVKQQAQAYNFAGARLEEDPYATGPAGKNLILTIPGQTQPGFEVLLTGHLDSIWQVGDSNTSAPGANDNGTGSATLLEAARLLRQYRFGRTIRIIFFTGEEQGLYGSAAYVADHSTGPVLGVVNLDMFGWDLNGDRCFEIHAGTLSQSQDVGNCFRDSIGSYSLGLTRDYLTTTATNRSDHASFWNVGVGAIEIAENYFNDNQAGGCVGSEPNPYYHTNNDTIALNMHPPFGFAIAKTALATIAAMALPIEACFSSSPVLTATPGLNQVDLSWSAVPGAASYRVYRSAQGCGGAFVAIADTPGTTYSDTNVSATTYAYKVEAVTADGQCFSAESACQTATPTFYHARAATAAYLDSCPGGGAGDANGAVEPGETVTVQVTLTNDGNATLTSLVGALSSATPGVSVVDGSATWPNLAPAASSPTDPDHFRIQLSPDMPCGAIVHLQVGSSAAEGGGWVDSLATSVGGNPTSATSTFPSTNVPKPIADAATTTSTLAVADMGTVQDVNVGVTLSHTYDGDLILTLIAPSGTRVTLANHRGASSDNYTGTTFDDEAATPISSGTPPFSGSYRPETPLSALDGIPSNGTWTLEITDSYAQDVGTLTAWSVTLTIATPTCVVCAAAPAPPGEAGSASPLLVSKVGGSLMLDWGVPPSPCAPPAGSAVYVGDLQSLLSEGRYSHDTALVCGAASHTLEIPLDSPSVGAAAYFLAVAENGVEEGSYGRRTGGTERPSSSAACRMAQNLASCP